MSIPIFNRAKNQNGFTLAEVLTVVVILTILFGIAAPNVMQTQKRLRQQQLDTNAQTIYVSVQNRLINLKSLSLSSTYQKESGNDVGMINGLCYITSLNVDNEDSASNYIMGKLVDRQLRNGYWVIEYDQDSAMVNSVYYSDLDDIASGYINAYETYDAFRNKDTRMASEINVGYYGG